MPFCPQCNLANHHSVRYCQQCGFQFLPNVNYPSPPISGKADKKGLIIAGVVIAAVLGFCGLISLASRQNNSNTAAPLVSNTSTEKTSQSTTLSSPTPSPTINAQTNVIEGKVVGVADGDTITVLNSSNTQFKIRLAGIDAPESSQDFGQKSKQNLSGLVFNRAVVVKYDKLDKYGRVLGKVILEGKDINYVQVLFGFAWHYKEYQDEQPEEDRKTYADAEIKARSSKSGLWSMPNPTPPWDYRHNESSSNNTKTDNNNQSNSTSAPTAEITPRVPSSSRVYIRGPRGGCYYVNRNGNKTYVDRSLCN